MEQRANAKVSVYVRYSIESEMFVLVETGVVHVCVCVCNCSARRKQMICNARALWRASEKCEARDNSNALKLEMLQNI